MIVLSLIMILRTKLLMSIKRTYRKMAWPLPSFLMLMSLMFQPCFCNTPPKLLLDNQQEGSAIVVRLKEGPHTPPGTEIFKLKAEDSDGDLVIFAVVRDPDQIIRVENLGSNEAVVVLTEELDAEQKRKHELVLGLTDGKLGNGKFMTRSMLILVEDVNDNIPVFKTYPSTVEVGEDTKVGTVVVTLEAKDKDSGIFGQVIYKLDPSEKDSDLFSITSTATQGIVRIKNTLDYERQSVHHLKVLASDRGGFGDGNTATAAILVKVNDVPDQPPEFVSVPSVTRIPEDTPAFSEVRGDFFFKFLPAHNAM